MVYLSFISIVLVTRGIFYVVPVLVVAASSVLSVHVLRRRRKENMQQRELQQSRNKATVTIILFALLFGICNIPYSLHIIVFSANLFLHGLTPRSDYEFYKFDEKDYYYTAISTLLLPANSAMNPILYLLRMPLLREYVLVELRKSSGAVRRLLLSWNTVSMETRQNIAVEEETRN